MRRAEAGWRLCSLRLLLTFSLALAVLYLIVSLLAIRETYQPTSKKV
jgi:hypothetical protein